MKTPFQDEARTSWTKGKCFRCNWIPECVQPIVESKGAPLCVGGIVTGLLTLVDSLGKN